MKKKIDLLYQVTADGLIRLNEITLGSIVFRRRESTRGDVFAAQTGPFKVQLVVPKNGSGRLLCEITVGRCSNSAATGISRQVRRLARKAHIQHTKCGRGGTIVYVRSYADERRLAAFLPGLNGRRMWRTVCASGAIHALSGWKGASA